MSERPLWLEKADAVWRAYDQKTGNFLAEHTDRPTCIKLAQAAQKESTAPNPDDVDQWWRNTNEYKTARWRARAQTKFAERLRKRGKKWLRQELQRELDRSAEWNEATRDYPVTLNLGGNEYRIDSRNHEVHVRVCPHPPSAQEQRRHILSHVKAWRNRRQQPKAAAAGTAALLKKGHAARTARCARNDELIHQGINNRPERVRIIAQERGESEKIVRMSIP